jgi:3-isopropylmalate/(R)-2-methylmalate dehydratase small subunit
LQIVFSKLSKQILNGLEVNLPEQIITLKATGEKESFDLRLQKKIYGFDDIDYLQNIKEV